MDGLEVWLAARSMAIGRDSMQSQKMADAIDAEIERRVGAKTAAAFERIAVESFAEELQKRAAEIQKLKDLLARVRASLRKSKRKSDAEAVDEEIGKA